LQGEGVVSRGGCCKSTYAICVVCCCCRHSSRLLARVHVCTPAPVYSAGGAGSGVQGEGQEQAPCHWEDVRVRLCVFSHLHVQLWAKRCCVVPLRGRVRVRCGFPAPLPFPMCVSSQGRLLHHVLVAWARLHRHHVPLVQGACAPRSCVRLPGSTGSTGSAKSASSQPLPPWGVVQAASAPVTSTLEGRPRRRSAVGTGRRAPFQATPVQ
jgi:hypothetical protein